MYPLEKVCSDSKSGIVKPGSWMQLDPYGYIYLLLYPYGIISSDSEEPCHQTLTSD